MKEAQLKVRLIDAFKGGRNLLYVKIEWMKFLCIYILLCLICVDKKCVIINYNLLITNTIRLKNSNFSIIFSVCASNSFSRFSFCIFIYILYYRMKIFVKVFHHRCPFLLSFSYIIKVFFNICSKIVIHNIFKMI